MVRDLKAKDENNNIIYIDKEKKAFDHIKTYQDLNTYIDAHYQVGKMNYILIDEIQEIEELEADRLFLNNMGTEEIGKNFLWHAFAEVATVNIL